MSFMEKIKVMIGASDEEYEDDMDMVNEEHNNNENQDAFDYDSNNGVKKNKVVNIHATTKLQVVLVKPEKF